MSTARNMPFQKLLLLCFLGLCSLGYAQKVTLSPSAKISLITCGAGEELYSTFGHSAFRVFDPDLGIDVIYNYGTFNFNTPNFYMKFARGKLLYSLSRQQFDNFLYEYQVENRWVKEQVLQLGELEKDALFQFLEHNYLPENREYKYDFFFDNCSTKLGTVLEQTFGTALEYDYSHLENHFTFRELIHQNLKTNSWSAFGIDLALGSVIDRTATPHEHLFLPSYVMRQLNFTTLGSMPIVFRERTILKEGPTPVASGFYTTPLFWLSVVLLIVAFITYWDFKKGSRNRWLDFSLFFATGIAGLVIIFLWFFSEHTTTVSNFNVFWAFPLNLVAGFLLLSKDPKGRVFRYYLVALLVFLGITLLLWVLKIQLFSPLLLLLLIALGLRYLFLHFIFKKIKA